jgi:hypothetical protein
MRREVTDPAFMPLYERQERLVEAAFEAGLKLHGARRIPGSSWVNFGVTDGFFYRPSVRGATDATSVGKAVSCLGLPSFTRCIDPRNPLGAF